MNSPRSALLALAAFIAFGVAPHQPQQPTEPPEAAAIRSLTWRSLGPANAAGRVSVVVGVPGQPDTFYVSGANGGIFKTTNGGTTYSAIFDDQDVISIGAIAIAPSDHNIIYVGTGEENPRNNASFGDGVYKSVDAGHTWTHIGLEDADRIARFAIDPSNANVVYACGLGHEWGPNEQRGVFKTVDGGKTWQRVLFKDAQTSCSDIDIDPTNANIVYAGMYTYRRWAWHLESGGGQTAVYKSVDGGTTWAKLTNGLPKGPMDRIGISVARSNPSTVYVVSETKDEGELWRTDDAGASWRVVNRDPNINFRPFYYSDIRVDPKNPERIFSLSGSLYLSDNGGKDFARIANDVHGDHQAMWIDPLRPTHILSGSDGGWQLSNDGGKTWEIQNMVAFTQFYHVAFDLENPYHVCGGLQDNGNWCGPVRTASTTGIRKRDWYTVSGGDGFFAVPALDAPYLVYSTSQGGTLTLTDIRTGSTRNIHPYPNKVGSVGDAMANHKYRFNWNPPIVLSRTNPKVVYFGGNVLFKTANHGQSWEVISPDLTTNDKSKQQSSGGPIVVDNTAAEFHCTILTIAPSPLDSNVIWVGTDDGNVQVTRDGGKSWTNVVKNIAGLAPAAWIPMVDASPSNAGTAYVAADHHQDDDYEPLFFKTTDYGKTWTKITGGLPARGWSHVVREDPKNRNVLYAGTELGVYVSFDGGGRWTSLRNGLPPVPVRDVIVHPRDNDLIVATHGRGMYVMDDVTALQQVSTALATDATLFDVRPATRWVLWNSDANLAEKEYSTPNPPYGALISYYLKSASDSVSVTIKDGQGQTVRRLARVPHAAGLNRVAWDLRHDTPTGAEVAAIDEEAPAAAAAGAGGAAGRGGRGAGGGGGRGGRGGGAPMALPTDYTVTLAVNGKELTKPVRVLMDPRVSVPMADLQAQMAAIRQMQQLSAKANGVVQRTDDLVTQLSALDVQLAHPAAADGPAPAGATDLVGNTLTKLKTFKADSLARPLAGLGYRQYPRLREEVGSLNGAIGGALAGPTDAQLLRIRELTAETEALTAWLNAVVATDVARINQLMGGNRIRF
ncbi:MAG TPA: FlgD immunoglobulin-like domain containing protein [Gemmatimonadales bacterium]|jgi:photosystem II stability/assembly factor-like uncharacterized protein